LIVEAAEKWHIPPWGVMGGSKTLWFARFEAVRAAEIKRTHKAQAETKKR
jgi:hypothetical protein